MLYNKKATHLVANRVPLYILTELVTIWNGNNPHETFVRFRARGLFKFIVRGPVNELRTASLWTDTGIVEICFDFGNFVGGKFIGDGTRDAVVAGL